MLSFISTKGFCASTLLLLALSAPLHAQVVAGSDKDSSKVSVFGGYSYLHYSNGTDTALYGASEKDITANSSGFVVSAAYNLTHMFAVVGEYGSITQAPLAILAPWQRARL